jgi:hypothetical protein
MVLSTVLALEMYSCTMSPMAGSSSEVTNGTVTAWGAPADSAIVIAYPAHYIPGLPGEASPETTFTDECGRFRLDTLGRGSWNLLIYDTSRALGAFVQLDDGDSDAGTIELDSLGSITGVVEDTAYELYASFVGVIGSPFFALIHTDTFSLNDMPPFTYVLSNWRELSGCTPEGCDPVMLIDTIDTVVLAPGGNPVLTVGR